MAKTPRRPKGWVQLHLIDGHHGEHWTDKGRIGVYRPQAIGGVLDHLNLRNAANIPKDDPGTEQKITLVIVAGQNIAVKETKGQVLGKIRKAEREIFAAHLAFEEERRKCSRSTAPTATP